MSDLEKLAKEWHEARKDMLAFLGDTAAYMKAKGKTMEIDSTPVFNEAWKRLSDAEWALSDFMKEM